MENIQYFYRIARMKTQYVPKSLTKTQKKLQTDSIKKGIDRPKLKGVPTRRSVHTIRAEKYFGKGNTSKNDMASKLSKSNATRKSRLLKAFDIIYNRGRKAYFTSGSRPNVTAEQWGHARVFSVLFGGKARTTSDADVVKEYRLPLLE
jgi:hypothetical protein